MLWIRSRRLQWLGHILRLGTERLIKQAVFEMYKRPLEDDLLMDVPKSRSGHELFTYEENREYSRINEYWRERVRKLRQPRISIQVGSHVVEGSWAPFTVST